ncbi:MAG: NADH-quinone oxidoreductase subunit M [Deltaproteobacteria bacterium]|nr:NADH-quinone oxidoreductase subunit M [Deltaproteobacteria bacterium]
MIWIIEHLLSTIIFLPLLLAVFLLVIPGTWERAIRWVSLFGSLLILGVTMLAWRAMSWNAGFELQEVIPWIPSVGITYKLGVDGTAMLLMWLAAFLVPIVFIGSWREVSKNVKMFHVLILLLETGMLGVFAALDVFLFYIFWEVVLIPMYFLIGMWGSGNRIRVAFKFILYTMAGSVLMLAAILYAAWQCGGTFDLLTWYDKGFNPIQQFWLFGAFALAFAIKVPMFPVHTWLPDTHTEAPTAGSVLLAGVLLKMGTYGFFRFAMPLFPLAVVKFAPLMLTLSVIGIVYGALVSLVQVDLKRLIAYSSVSHLGFVMLGLFSLEPHAVQGAIIQMINHGLSTGALFLMVGMIYHRRHSRLIADYGGIARIVPMFAALFIFLSFASVGMPGLNNFVGEFLVLLGTFQTQTPYAAIAVLGVILAAGYMLWAVQRVFFGPITHDENRALTDLTGREYLALLPLVALIVAIGVYPKPWLSKIESSTEQFLKLTKRVEMIVPVAKNTTGE